MVNKYEVATTGSKKEKDTDKEKPAIRENIAGDADTFINKVRNKFLSKKKQEEILKIREKEGIQSIADGAFPVSGVEYNFTELIRFKEIYGLIQKSHIQEYDAQGNLLKEYEMDNFNEQDMVFKEHAPNLFKFIIETVPTYNLVMPLSKEEMYLVQYTDTKEVDVLKLKELPKKGVKIDFTAFEISELLGMIKKSGLNLNSFIRRETGETYAGKSKRGF